MLAVVAAVIFGLALILDWANVNASDAFTPQTLLMAGLLCLSLHLAGFGGAVRTGTGTARGRAWRR